MEVPSRGCSTWLVFIDSWSLTSDFEPRQSVWLTRGKNTEGTSFVSQATLAQGSSLSCREVTFLACKKVHVMMACPRPPMGSCKTQDALLLQRSGRERKWRPPPRVVLASASQHHPQEDCSWVVQGLALNIFSLSFSFSSSFPFLSSSLITYLLCTSWGLLSPQRAVPPSRLRWARREGWVDGGEHAVLPEGPQARGWSAEPQERRGLELEGHSIHVSSVEKVGSQDPSLPPLGLTRLLLECPAPRRFSQRIRFS